MDHTYFRDKVSAFYDRELPAQEQALLEEHVASCPECQKLLAELERLDQVVASRLELGASDYWEQSALKIEERLGFVEKTEITPVTKSAWDRGLVWKLSAVAASVALLVFIGINKDDILNRNVTDPNQQRDTSVGVMQDTTALRSAPANTDTEQVETQETKQPAAESQEKKAESQTSPVAPPPASKQAAPSVGAGSDSRDEAAADIAADSYNSNVQRQSVETRTRTERLAEPSRTAPIADSESSLEEPASISAQTEAAEQEMAARIPEPDSVSVVAESDLSRWRIARDSLGRALEAPKQTMMERYGVSTLQKPDRRKTAAAAVAPSAATSRIETEKRYLEACFQVALLTSDADEYRTARQAMEDIAGQVGSANATLAGDYLSRLKSERPTPPQK